MNPLPSCYVGHKGKGQGNNPHQLTQPTGGRVGGVPHQPTQSTKESSAQVLCGQQRGRGKGTTPTNPPNPQGGGGDTLPLAWGGTPTLGHIYIYIYMAASDLKLTLAKDPAARG